MPGLPLSSNVQRVYSVGGVAFAKRIEVNGDIIYVGTGDAGADPAAAVWQIFRFTIIGDLYHLEFADGNHFLDNVWDNRASLSYS
jgi:hypothetical protein